jgi:hypothetical protein
MNSMTLWIKRFVAASAVMLLIASLAAGPAYAATGRQGYAVYRDGVYGNYTWHAAIMSLPYYNSGTLPVIHHPGNKSGTTKMVEYGTWSEFLGGKVYQGTYRPKVAPTSANGDAFLSMARRLVDEKIPYDAWYQVDYNVSTAGTRVDPGEIKGMRCDGVVEYIYEWYGFKVYGNTSGQWDVTKAAHVLKDLHSGPNVTPKTQAQSYLTKITSSLP